MSKEQRKPAHEVIIDKLTDALAEVERSGPETPDSISSRVLILCAVLGEMAIPEEHRGEIVAKVHELHNRCTNWPLRNSALKILVIKLDEHMTEK